MSGKHFAVRAAAGALACLVSHGCRSPASERPADAKYETIRPEWRGTEVHTSREWLRFSTGFDVRTEPSDDPLDDSFALALDGGFDLAQTVWTPSLELGIGYTSAHVFDPDAAENSVDLWRATIGLRETYYANGWRPFVRAGGFLRWSTDDLEEPLDPYATGIYAGVGVDWPYAGMWLGPSITYYRALGEDSPGGDTEEFLFALSATFRL